MAEDFKVKIEADLDTAQADEKIEKLVNKKRTIKLDVDINGQNAKSITDNIQKGLSKTKLDTSNISKQIADSFNISDKSVISKIQTQLNEMMTSLSKTWNGKNFDFKNASGWSRWQRRSLRTPGLSSQRPEFMMIFTTILIGRKSSCRMISRMHSAQNSIKNY